eukprot:gnl/MRDRNA2_/MRDRNA2_67036_c0_seq2.p1 gnl/MRDRNA2_/MRDRNA2_67036_c0~~gnl/MRDRNA2_/MRDRNA2_67036_c0_seq2.p1  ORF type:complete len:336 (+),score=43.88 gnl/MRDRNA2_/MRDRNA2_67036_c0_seq2:119-1126(+)
MTGAWHKMISLSILSAAVIIHVLVPGGFTERAAGCSNSAVSWMKFALKPEPIRAHTSGLNPKKQVANTSGLNSTTQGTVVEVQSRQTSNDRRGVSKFSEVSDEDSYDFSLNASSTIERSLVSVNVISRAEEPKGTKTDLPKKLTFKSKFLDVRTNDAYRVEFEDMTQQDDVRNDAALAKVYPDWINYVAYAYPEQARHEKFGHFLYFDANHKLVAVVNLVDTEGRTDTQFDGRRTRGKGTPNCEMRPNSMGFKDVKGFCWSSGCKKKEGDRWFPDVKTDENCFLFEMTDGSLRGYFRNKATNKLTWVSWSGQYNFAIHKSMFVPMVVALFALHLQ